MNKSLWISLTLIFFGASCQKSVDGRSTGSKKPGASDESPTAGSATTPSPAPSSAVSPAAKSGSTAPGSVTGNPSGATGSSGNGGEMNAATFFALSCGWDVQEGQPPQVTGKCDLGKAQSGSVTVRLLPPALKETLSVTGGGVTGTLDKDFFLNGDHSLVTIGPSLLTQDHSVIVISYQGSTQKIVPQNVYHGFDLYGKEGDCPIKNFDNVACSEVVGPGDRYAAACKSAGHTAYMCNCHVFLCSQKISFDPNQI
jgi:hypothetical protein